MLGVGDGQVFMSSKGFFLYQVQRDFFFEVQRELSASVGK